MVCKFIFIISILSSFLTINANLIICRNNYVKKSPQESVTKLMSACVEGDLKKVEDLVYRYPGINAQDAHGRTALYYAVMHKQHNIVNFLLTCKRIDINLSDNEGIAPLVIAIENDDVEMVKILLNDQRLNKEVRDKRIKFTPLMRAVKANTAHCLEIAKLLIDAGVNLTSGVRKDNQFICPIDLAQVNGADQDFIDYMKDKKKKYDIRSMAFTGYFNGYCGNMKLHFDQLIRNKNEYLRKLFYDGMNVNYINHESFINRIPIQIAILANDEYLVRLLIEQGADVNAKDINVENALHIACKREILRQRKFQQPYNNTFKNKIAFKVLARFPQNNIEKILIDAGCDVDAVNYNGDTPLIIAAKSHNLVAVKALLKAGADIDKKNGIFDFGSYVAFGDYEDKEIYELYLDYKIKNRCRCRCTIL